MTLHTRASHREGKTSLLKTIWRGWLRFAEILGTVQMVIILTLVYWLVLAIMALPFKLLADPLAARGPHRVQWVRRQPVEDMRAEMQKQG